MASTPNEGKSEWIDERIAQQVAHLIAPGLPWGSRLHAIVEEISNQEEVVTSFSAAVRRDIPGETYAKKYLAALKRAKSDLQAQATESGPATDYEDEMVYWSVHAAILRERAGKTPTPIDLASLYREFKEKYFNGSVPELSQSFLCAFSKLPFDTAGILLPRERRIKTWDKTRHTDQREIQRISCGSKGRTASRNDSCGWGQKAPA